MKPLRSPIEVKALFLERALSELMRHIPKDKHQSMKNTFSELFMNAQTSETFLEGMYVICSHMELQEQFVQVFLKEAVAWTESGLEMKELEYIEGQLAGKLPQVDIGGIVSAKDISSLIQDEVYLLESPEAFSG